MRGTSLLCQMPPAITAMTPCLALAPPASTHHPPTPLPSRLLGTADASGSHVRVDQPCDFWGLGQNVTPTGYLASRGHSFSICKLCLHLGWPQLLEEDLRRTGAGLHLCVPRTAPGGGHVEWVLGALATGGRRTFWLPGVPASPPALPLGSSC